MGLRRCELLTYLYLVTWCLLKDGTLRDGRVGRSPGKATTTMLTHWVQGVDLFGNL